SGAEDLVPCLKKVVDPTTGTETWEPEDPVHRPPHTVYRYRPRTEGLFARIERWEHDATHEVHWRATTKDNITSIYGGSSASRLADPDNAQRVYEWLLHETFDATGNHILYEYATDNPKLYTHEDPVLSAEHHPVPIRDDCFSSFRAGFEMRTLRRCHRILMFHHFAELGSPTLVRSTDFTYHNNLETRVSFLTAVTVTGYQKDAIGV